MKVTYHQSSLPFLSNQTGKQNLPPAADYLLTLAPKSQKTMKNALERIIAILGPGQSVYEFQWHKLTSSQIKMARAILGERYSKNSANLSIMAYKGVIKSSWAQGLIDADARDRLSIIKAFKGDRKKVGRALKQSEIDKLVTSLYNEDSKKARRDLALLVGVLLDLGLRREEAHKLDLEHLDMEEGSLQVIQGKGSRNRKVFFSPGAQKLINRWLEVRGTEAGPLFYSIRRGDNIQHGQRVSYEGIRDILVARVEQAGLKPISLHGLRKSFITGMLNAGADLLIVQNAAGHKSPTSTAAYDMRGQAELKRASRLRYYGPIE